MALLHPKPFELPAEVTRARELDPCGPAEIEYLAVLLEQTSAMPEGHIEGALLRFPVADGYAYYRVSSACPLTLQHMPLLDQYSISPAYIRDIEAHAVFARIERERHISRLLRGTRTERFSGAEPQVSNTPKPAHA